MATNDKQRLSFIFNFVKTFQNQIKRIDFDINTNSNKQICGIIELNENSDLEAIEQFLINKNCNSIFDYWEFDRNKMFIEME